MSWAEIKKAVNDNFNYPLNKQNFYPVNFNTTAEWFEQSTTYTAQHSGVYIVTCVGKGGNALANIGELTYSEVYVAQNYASNFYRSSGGGGAVCKGYVILSAGQTVAITVDTTKSSFGNYVSAGAGADGNYQFNTVVPAAAGGAVLIAGNISNHAGFPGQAGAAYSGSTMIAYPGGDAGIITPYSLNESWSHGYLPLTNFTELTGGDGGYHTEEVASYDGKPGKFGGGTGASVRYLDAGVRGGGGYGGGGNWDKLQSVSGHTGWYTSASWGGKGVVIIEHGITIFG